ncbi:MAG: HD domain-containing protein [Christensenellaceae bacterium]|jgi:5'-deoxynucleotidase YfbR-like HD superfamily hydrolase|nr:HD domain-containing protein [Christensenellaceae bacterium]
MNDKVKSITAFNKLTNKLKNVVRSGWKNWGVSAPRLESVAEHSHGSQMLAYAVYENYKDKYPNVNIERVIAMLAFHEMEEILMPDYTPFDKITKEEKRKQGQQAVENVASVLPQSDYMRSLIQEFEQAQTPDGKFAKMVDSLEAGLQSQIYDEQGHIDLNNPKAQNMLNSHDLHGRGHNNLSDSWLAYCTESYNYDNNFKEIANQAQGTRTEKLQQLAGQLKQLAEKKEKETK